MKGYFAYIRVSTTRQGEHGSSLQEQRSAIEAYAARNFYPITAWFEDQETAAKQGRKEFTRLTRLLRDGQAKGVIIHKIDRSARNLRDWAGLGELIDSGIEVLFAHEALDLTTRGGRLAADIQAVVAADFIRNLRDEVMKGFVGRLKQGFYPLPAPRGYLDRGKAKAKSICPVEGPLVTQAFELYATGTWSLESLRHEMARRGLKAASGKPLSLDAIASMLHNPFYIGMIRVSTLPELFEGQHTPLVPKAMFEKVQAIMAGRHYPRIERHQFIFRRLVKCAACSRSLTGERQRGHVYYRCHNHGCPGVSIAETVLDEAVAQIFDSLALRPVDLRDLRDLLAKRAATERESADSQAEYLDRDLAQVEQRLARLTDAFIDGSVDKETFDARKNGLLTERRHLRARLERPEKVTFWQGMSKWFEQDFEAYLGYRKATEEQKRRFAKLACSNIVVRGKEPQICLAFPFQEIATWAKSADGGPYRGAVRTFAARRSQAPASALLLRLARCKDGPEKVPEVPQVHPTSRNGPGLPICPRASEAGLPNLETATA